MTLREYVTNEDGTSRRGEMARIAREAGVDYKTVWLLARRRGHRLSDYHTAKRISKACGGRVTVADLCEPSMSSAGA